LRPPGTLHVVDEGDHSFKVPRKGPVSQELVYSSVLDRVAEWSLQVVTGSRSRA
jgi:hypothetical protein